MANSHHKTASEIFRVERDALTPDLLDPKYMIVRFIDLKTEIRYLK